MTSNLFAGSTPNIKPPAVCKFTKPPLVPWVPDELPPELGGIALWADHDPLAYRHVSAMMTLYRIPGEDAWFGSATKGPHELSLSLERLGDTDLWAVNLRVIDDFPPPEGESIDWVGITIQTVPTFDTDLLTHVVIPGTDYREVLILQ